MDSFLANLVGMILKCPTLIIFQIVPVYCKTMTLEFEHIYVCPIFDVIQSGHHFVAEKVRTRKYKCMSYDSCAMYVVSLPLGLKKLHIICHSSCLIYGSVSKRA